MHISGDHRQQKRDASNVSGDFCRSIGFYDKSILATQEPLPKLRRQRDMRTSVYAFLALCLLALLATSCSSDDDSDAGIPTALEGREFWSTWVTIGGESKELIDNTCVVLRFNGNQIGASAGCNSMGGTLKLKGSTLTVTNLFMTEMGCDPGRHEQDDFVATTLLASPTAKLDSNDLTLTTGNVTIQLLDASVANPDREIIGNLWAVTGFIDGQTVSSFAVDVPGHLVFHENSTLTGFDGCANFSAPIEISDGSTGGPVKGDGEMQFGPIDRAPAADCANPGYAEAFHQLFATGGATFTINGANLTIVNARGVGVMLSER